MKKRFSTFVFLFSLSGLSFSAVFPSGALIGVALLAIGMVAAGIAAIVGATAAPAIGLGLGLIAAGSVIPALLSMALTPDVNGSPNLALPADMSVVITPNINADPGNCTAACAGCGIDGANFYTYQCNVTDAPKVVSPDGKVSPVALGAPRATSASDTPNPSAKAGAGTFGGTGATGTWSAGATGGWDFAATDGSFSANVSDDKVAIKSNNSDEALVLRTDSNGDYIVAYSSRYNLTDPQGNPVSAVGGSAQRYDSTGAPVGLPAIITTSDSNGNPVTPEHGLSPDNGGDGTPLWEQSPTTGITSTGFQPCVVTATETCSGPAGSPTGTDTGDGGGGTGGTGTGGSGSCSSGDCSTETTQLANKGLLQAIKDFFTGTSTAPGDPDSKTSADIKAVGLSGSGTFSGLSGWTLPGHSSTCPVSSFSWEGRTFAIDAHCQLINDNFGVFRAIMTAVFSISALFIVLKA